MSEELKRERSVTYECVTCALKEGFTPEQFKEHLKTVHKLTDYKGAARMTLHLDTATHYISSYEGEIHGIKFLKSTRDERETAFRLRQRKAER